jgi:hypothetical protein
MQICWSLWGHLQARAALRGRAPRSSGAGWSIRRAPRASRVVTDSPRNRHRRSRRDTISTIYDAAPDGSVQVGTVRTRRGNPTYLPDAGVLWDCQGVRDLAAELTAAGVDLQGTWLYNPVRVWSGTSIMIVGYGLANGVSDTRAWIAWLPNRC